MNLPPGFEYHADALAPAQADDLLETLRTKIDWRRRRVKVFGAWHEQPRLTAWCADPGATYRYSGLRLVPRAWHPALASLRDELRQRCGQPFNSVLLNAYRDGRDAMGWHADNEPELGDEPFIASVSLGATRRFRIRPAAGGASQGFDLGHGSLLLMHSRSQADWRHAIPRTRKAVGWRINLTFRTIRRARPLRNPGG